MEEENKVVEIVETDSNNENVFVKQDNESGYKIEDVGAKETSQERWGIKEIKSTLFIALGILTIIFAIVSYASSVGNSEGTQRYGGDAYTGIQNASAQSANNVVNTNKILSFGFGSIFMVAGLTFEIVGIAGVTGRNDLGGNVSIEGKKGENP